MTNKTTEQAMKEIPEEIKKQIEKNAYDVGFIVAIVFMSFICAVLAIVI